jgi:alanine dehydrogenase
MLRNLREIGSSFADSCISGFESADFTSQFDLEPSNLVQGAELIVKVKEPQRDEVAMLREGQMLFTYLHLAADRALT